MPVITIDKRNFIKGQSTADTLSDGGFSNDSTVEVLRNGSTFAYLNWGRTKTESSTNIASYIAASAFGNNLRRYSIDETGKLYETNVTSYTHTLKYTESVKAYDTTSSSIISYKNKLYITSTTDIYRENYTFSENDDNWWTGTLGKTALTTAVPHILFEFNDLLYVTNGNKVWSTDGTVGYTTGSNTLTLTDDWIIYKAYTSGTDIYLFAVFKSLNTSYNKPNKIFVWDGYSESWTREIVLSTDMIRGITMTSTGIYFSDGNYLYKFDGYNYSIVPTNLGEGGVKTMVSNKNDIFYVGGTSIYKYNTTYGATCKIATFATYEPVFIFNDYQDEVTCFTRDQAVSKGVYYYLTNNLDTTSFYSNYYDFERPVYLRKIEIVFSAATVTNTSYTARIRNELDSSIQEISITDVGIQKFTKLINHHLDSFRLHITSNHASNKPIKWIKIYYDPSERSNNK